NMAPITTADFVGLDVHKAIVDNLYTSTQDYANATFQLPNFVNKIIDAGNLGRKSHKGLYQTIIRDDGTKRLYVYDILTDSYREKYDYKFPFVEKMIENLKIGDYQKALDSLIENQSLEARLCVEFLLKYALYSLVATNLVGDTIADADSVMADGFGWVPPLALIHALGGTDTFYKLCRERLGEAYFSKAEPGTLPNELPTSKYDYRRYFRAKY
ncbi:3-hydroxyacyl-CoA dehydrogenase family protein, partial [Mediterraneibacter glycyrrhizinilyticus]